MTVRSIRPEELDVCCAPGGGSWLAEAVRTLWADGRSSPDLCFVAEHDGKQVGRAFFHCGESQTWSGMFGFHVDAAADFRETGMALLAAAVARLTESGATCLSEDIYDIYEKEPARLQELLEAVGFKQYQEKRRYVWKDGGAPVAVPSRLGFRSLSVVGEGAYIEALRRVTEGTLDRDDQADIATHGLDAAGAKYMTVLRDIEFLPDQWQLGFLPDGKLCGLVVPQLIDVENEGVINYIGVVPELRGFGYGFDLLMKGTALLQQRGLKKVVAETDVENRPLHAELEQAGYVHKGTLKNFRLDLPRPANG